MRYIVKIAKLNFLLFASGSREKTNVWTLKVFAVQYIIFTWNKLKKFLQISFWQIKKMNSNKKFHRKGFFCYYYLVAFSVAATVASLQAENTESLCFSWDCSALHFQPLSLKVNWLPVDVLFTSVLHSPFL